MSEANDAESLIDKEVAVYATKVIRRAMYYCRSLHRTACLLESNLRPETPQGADATAIRSIVGDLTISLGAELNHLETMCDLADLEDDPGTLH
ncbi:hypothetical protein ACS8YF_12610 [Salinisphaera sp. SWV1]|uniref:hypothetical protein n=1 Tax=Salinisphaera sp. SWV1 TaxID=3454139 RepID=UPI003F85CAE9